MKKQNFSNHARFVPLYHFVASLLLIAILVGSFINIVHSSKENLYSASLICALTFVLAIVWFYMRVFALKAQDRAIRAEENFRYFILTGKPLDNRLRMEQIIALRFASDEEFPSLAEKAIADNFSNKEIKMAVKNWKADHYRA